MAVYIYLAIPEQIACEENGLNVRIQSSEGSVNRGIVPSCSSD